MTLRQYGGRLDPIPLRYIKRTPSMSGVVAFLMNLPTGTFWPMEHISALKDEVNAAGLEMEVVEGVNVHEGIKLNLSGRDAYVDNYRETVRQLDQAGIKVIYYDFIPVSNWTRTDLAKPQPDGSTVLVYDQAVTDHIIGSQAFADRIQQGAREFRMMGQESERMAELKRLFAQHRNTSHGDLFRNLKYLLETVIPVCEQYDVKMTIHLGDPPQDIFDLPRIRTRRENMHHIMELVDSLYNRLTSCSGLLGSSPCNDIPTLIREFGGGGHIHFAHVRNIKSTGPGRFEGTAHLSDNGDLDLHEIMETYYDMGLSGYIRPDHGRMIRDEKGRVGHGLYDRALGASYPNSLWEVIQRDNIQYNGQNGAAAT